MALCAPSNFLHLVASCTKKYAGAKGQIVEIVQRDRSFMTMVYDIIWSDVVTKLPWDNQQYIGNLLILGNAKMK